MGSKLSLDEFLDFCALFQGISHNHNEHKIALQKLRNKKKIIYLPLKATFSLFTKANTAFL